MTPGARFKGDQTRLVIELVRAGAANELNRGQDEPWQLGPVAEDYARFAGFGDRDAATEMCNQLKKAKMSCLAMQS